MYLICDFFSWCILHRHSSSYSIGVRLKSETEMKDQSVPGAGKYNSNPSYKKLYDTLPQFSIYSKPKLYNNMSNIPAPNKYFPKHNPKRKSAPKYSMKPRLLVGSPMYAMTSNRRGPGPGAYNLKSTVSAQQYKIKFKPRRSLSNKNVTPAPNHYKPDRGSRPQSAHSYSMLFRRQVKNHMHESPGPIYNTLRPLGYQQPF